MNFSVEGVIIIIIYFIIFVSLDHTYKVVTQVSIKLNKILLHSLTMYELVGVISINREKFILKSSIGHCVYLDTKREH